MAKIRHIALATNDPERTAAFYKEAFGFREVARSVDKEAANQLAWGVYLSDGTLNLAILKFKNIDQLGRGLDYVGLHHFGILVEDDESWIERLETMGAKCFMRRPENAGTSFFETKFHGPDDVLFDISEHPWAGAEPLGKK
jgi:catechol 2,3-dioxygenase-like lactoylglutathione lyase family enzyme